MNFRKSFEAATFASALALGATACEEQQPHYVVQPDNSETPNLNPVEITRTCEPINAPASQTLLTEQSVMDYCSQVNNGVFICIKSFADDLLNRHFDSQAEVDAVARLISEAKDAQLFVDACNSATFNSNMANVFEVSDSALNSCFTDPDGLVSENGVTCNTTIQPARNDASSTK